MLIIEQIRRLKQFFPGLNSADEGLAEANLPAGAEEWLAIPRWQKIASSYGQAVEAVVAQMQKTFSAGCGNYCEDRLGSNFLQQRKRIKLVFEEFTRQQDGCDILIVPLKFSSWRQGGSVCRSQKVFGSGEFGLGVFGVGIMLLTHTELLQSQGSSPGIMFDCAGDEYSPHAFGAFTGAPLFDCCRGNVNLDVRHYDYYSWPIATRVIFPSVICTFDS